MFSKKIVLFCTVLAFGSKNLLAKYQEPLASLDRHIEKKQDFYISSEILQFLIKHADLNAVDESETTMLMYAVKNNALDFANVLLQTGKVNNINQKDKLGRTAFMYAVLQCNSDMINLLVEFGADMSLTDNNGKTAAQLLDLKLARM